MKSDRDELFEWNANDPRVHSLLGFNSESEVPTDEFALVNEFLQNLFLQIPNYYLQIILISRPYLPAIKRRFRWNHFGECKRGNRWEDFQKTSRRHSVHQRIVNHDSWYSMMPKEPIALLSNFKGCNAIRYNTIRYYAILYYTNPNANCVPFRRPQREFDISMHPRFSGVLLLEEF